MIVNENTPSPGLPKGQEALVKATDVLNRYILFYISGNNTTSNFKIFDFSGDIYKAIERAKEHCTKLGIRFIRVKPFLTDLLVEEQLNHSNR